ncbi:MAG: helix-turn-helix domain-containing protein [Leptolyngbyaceae cyanobacterium]
MPTPLRVQLNEEEDEALQQLSLSDGPAPIVKQRALALRLNAEGWNVPAIAQHLHLHEQTVCQVAISRSHTKSASTNAGDDESCHITSD